MSGEQFALMMQILRSIDGRLKSAVELLEKIEGERLPAIESSVDSGCNAVESAVIRN